MDYIAISQLNDFIFCPYSIYLHNVYMELDEDLYKAMPQIKGGMAHNGITEKSAYSSSDVLLSFPILSEELGVYGVLDMLKVGEGVLIERKYQLNNIFQGQIYQLWAQYFCLKEMNYMVNKLCFYEISKRKYHPVKTPQEADKQELIGFLTKFRQYDPFADLTVNTRKCIHCIYCNLCDKTVVDNVYT